MGFRKVVFFIVIIASVLVINNLVHSIYDLYRKKDLIETAKQEIDSEKVENMQLRAKLTEVQDAGFVEREARDKLFMSRQGESVVVLPNEVLRATAEAEPRDTRANWEKWWDLFF